MNQQPDKFFRDKLDGYQRPAPAAAWDKIISAERKKKHRVIWLQVAASILPLILAGYILWPIQRVDDSTPIATKNNNDKPASEQSGRVPDVSDDSKKNKAQSDINVPHLAERKSSSPAKRNSTPRTDNVPPSNGEAGVNHNNNKKSDAFDHVNEQTVAQSSSLKEDAPLALDATQIASVDNNKNERKTMTLVYSANDVSQYLDKNIDDEATSNAKKPSTLKKLLMKANDLSAQDPLGELRQKKNEILALNFKGKGNVDKTSKQ